jgi:hypothetical protein
MNINFKNDCMRKLIVMIAFLGILSGVTSVSAQEYGPTDYIYTSATMSAYLKFNINDELQNVYFATGEKWLEYDIVEDKYMGEGKGWVYTIKDGMGNIYKITRKGYESNITVSLVKGKVVTLVRKIMPQNGN